MKKYFAFEKLREFDQHKMVNFLFNSRDRLKGFIAIHRGNTVKPAFGATRIWNYTSEVDGLEEALKLSKLMSAKAALAGLEYGGAKAVIINPQGIFNRKNMLRSYSHYVNYLNGHFITGADVGVNMDDLKVMESESPYMVGLKSDPVKFTALGAFYGIQVCLKEVYGTEDLAGRTFAIKGLGKTGMALLKLIYKIAGKIFVADIDDNQVTRIKREFPNAIVVNYNQIHKQKVDVYSPCALSNSINLRNISDLKCKIIAGIANIQLENSAIGELLHKFGILYAPDYVLNAGGLITVVDEYENKDSMEARVTAKVARIKDTLKTIIDKSKRRNMATNLIADQMAEKIYNKIQ